MSRRFATVAGAAVLSILACAATSSAAAPQPAGPQIAPVGPGAVAVPAKPAPAFKAGASVTDRGGTVVGAIESVIDTPAGLMVVVKIDGKLVSVPQSSLTLRDGAAVSRQSKAEMLAAAGAPAG
jgi:hypothetical protein